MAKNYYLKQNLDNLLSLSRTLNQYHNRFIMELVNSSFLIAHDENHRPVLLILDNSKYALIFTDKEEYEKAFPGDDSYLDMEFSRLKNALNGIDLDGFILNISTQNLYLSRKFINDLENLPNLTFDCCEACTAEEILSLKHSVNNDLLEKYIKNPKEFQELLGIISSNPLFTAVTCDKDMDILEYEGVIDAMEFAGKYDFYRKGQYATIFTNEDKLKDIETSKFKYLSLVDFARIAHYSIGRELKGIVINPNEEAYMIPTEELLENWPLINRMCHNERLISGMHYLFKID